MSVIVGGRRFTWGSLEAVLNELSDLLEAVSGSTMVEAGVGDMLLGEDRSWSFSMFGV